MTAPATPRLQDLLDLAREPSSARRRELLRGVTDIFIQHEPTAAGPELRGFDDVLCALATGMEKEVRVELSRRFAAAGRAPDALVVQLANDEIEVASPILADSRLLTEADLLEVVRTRGQAHLRVVSARDGLSEAVSDVIVDRGDDQTLKVLVANPTATLSRRASETVVDRALHNADLQDAVVGRETLPIDLLNEMYFKVESRLRDRIRERNANMDPGVLEAALMAGRERAAAEAGVLPPDYAEAEAQVARAARLKKLTAAELVGYLRANKRSHFLAAMVTLSGVEVAVLQHIATQADLDALAIICKAAELDRAAFMTIAVLISGERDAMTRAQTYGRLYSELGVETAQRTLRFWRVRRDADGAVAA